MSHGFQLTSDGTDNHLMLVDLRKSELTGKVAQETLDKARITVNRNAVPFDTRSPFRHQWGSHRHAGGDDARHERDRKWRSSRILSRARSIT